MTFRQLRVLIDGLPPESRLKTAVRDAMTQDEWDALPEPAGFGPWSRTDHLLATVADRIAVNTHVLVSVNSEKGKRPEPPKPIQRPGVGPLPVKVDPDQQRRVLAYVQYLRDHQGAAPPEGWSPDDLPGPVDRGDAE